MISIIITVNISKESAGISNFDIKKFIEKSRNTDLKADVVRICRNQLFCHFYHLIRKKGARYPFIDPNANRSDRAGTHRWSILDLHHKKTIYLFDSFELLGLKNIIVQDDKKIINKTLFGLEKTKLTDNNLTLVKTNEKAIKQTKCKG